MAPQPGWSHDPPQRAERAPNAPERALDPGRRSAQKVGL